MKRPWVAFVFSFLVPGAGLAYIGRWGLAVGNLVTVTAIWLAIVLVPSFSEYLADHLQYVLLVLAAASGGFAHGLATQRRRQVDSA